MAIQIYYEAGADATYEDVTARYRAATMEIAQAAEEGSVETSRIEFDDPDGDYEFVVWRRLIVFETSASSGYKHIGSFWIGKVEVTRTGGVSTFLTEAGRVWTLELMDDNALLDFRIMSGIAKRPAETDVARMQWLLGTAQMNRVPVTTYLSTANPVAMDANVDYNGQKTSEIVQDCADQSGKNFFLYTVENGGTPADLSTGIWYGAYDLTSAAWDSDLTISNILADVDTVDCFAMSDDTVLARAGERVYSGGYLAYDGGAVYSERTATSNTYTRRDTNIVGHNVKTATKAKARVQRELRDIATPEDVITTAIRVPAASVNRVRAGYRVQLRSTHLPGYTTWTWLRILRRSVRHLTDGYLVSLDLGNPTPGATDALCTNLTATGSFYPLGGSGNVPNPSGGNVFYLRPGLSYPEAVTVDHQGSWHFPVYGAGGAATVDYAGDCGLNIVRCLVVGDGTMEIFTATYSGSARTLVARLMHADPGAPTGYVVDETQTGSTSTTFTFTVSTHGGANCVHWVDIGDDGGTCGGKWGFSGFDWTAS